MSTSHTAAQTPRVSTIELFFDLVFVFTITRVAHLVEHGHTLLDYLRALLVLTLVWWIYAGYVWLTNGAGNERRMRPVLIAAMIGFLMIALAIPGVYHGAGLMFGLAYLYVIVLHLAAFYSLGPGLGPVILRLAWFNVGAALLALAAGVIHASWSWMLMGTAVALLFAATLRHAERGFPIHAQHFVERHGLILIIALGETIVALGLAAAEYGFTIGNIAGITTVVVLLAAIWWSYFDSDDARAEHALLAVAADDRASVAIRAFWTPYLVMIFGIVLIAAGVKGSGAEPANPTHARLFSVGLALFLVGSALFRRAIGISGVRTRLVFAAGAAATALAAGLVRAHPILGALMALMVIMLVFEARMSRVS